MRKTITTCDRCGTGECGARWKPIIIPTTTAGGDGVLSWDELCWDCYCFISDLLVKIYNKHRVIKG